MNSNVKVTADEAGNVISQSKNPEYGYVRLVQDKTLIDDTGFLRKKEVSALLQGKMEDLISLNLKAGAELEGKIVIKESLTPFNINNPQADLKVAGSTGIPCTLQGSPIYRETVYSNASNASDTLIKHDNVEELRAAFDAQKVTVEDFNL